MCLRRNGRPLLLGGAVLLALASCSSETAVGPLPDNPLDIRSPQTQGDPFSLQAETGAQGVQLRWTSVAGVARVVGYTVYRQVDQGAFAPLWRVEGAGIESFIDSAVAAGHRYVYFVVARDAEGRESVMHAGRAACELGPDWVGTGEVVVSIQLPE